MVVYRKTILRPINSIYQTIGKFDDHRCHNISRHPTVPWQYCSWRLGNSRNRLFHAAKTLLQVRKLGIHEDRFYFIKVLECFDRKSLFQILIQHSSPSINIAWNWISGRPINVGLYMWYLSLLYTATGFLQYRFKNSYT